MEKEKKINSLEVATKQVDTAAKHLKLNPGLIEKVRQTKRELTVHFPVKAEWSRPASCGESIRRKTFSFLHI